MNCLEELEAEDSSLDQPIDDSDSDPDYTLDQPIDDSDSDPDYTEQSITHQKVDYFDENKCDSDTDDNNTDNINTITSQTMQEMPDALPEYFLAKNGFKWSSKEPPTGLKIAQHNVLKSKPGMTYTLRRLGPKPQLEDIWSHLFDTEILQEIITWTNVKLDAVRLKVKEHQKSNYRATDEMEIKVLLGLLMLTAIYKSNREDILSLFSTKSTGRPIFRAVMSGKRFVLSLFSTKSTGRPIFRAVMSGKRFEILILALRIDNPANRDERKNNNPSAAIMDIFQRFVKNCQNLYSLGAYACMDDMLIPFRGRCKFKVYMPAKPNIYGLKVLALTDARTSYFYNGYLYCGKGSDGLRLSYEDKKFSVPTQTVLRLFGWLHVVGKHEKAIMCSTTTTILFIILFVEMALVALKSSYDQSNKCEIRKIWNQPQLKGELRATQRFINVVAECF
ncbi:Transposase IS4 [Popillia japonica]|uniref:Transposase IS4 n=1 Tax=Popillia japonica TaxID=7064 RepID=A0AAW1KKC0_POPJA